ncbi:hypothetical protein ONS95_010098 [Cadophora gregata]|uniref:uncharacterized protein n=1 Tax=Cadophora gregata TaxID=51156 RepID=UPI0026DBCC17|nr:uncharacterized protein ONS95_010098 [Cadophora gregata]KAK0121815.1 hypothetical protein ONS95_010098 [Cadophora gregata]KAK0127294.1 hypothetical protein ONS96_006844 [Cadophora gregata f. sp. sojae]
MPLKVSSESPSELEASLKATATTSKPAFFIVYASLVNGKSWCGDCRDAESFVNSKFASGEDVVKVVYAGQRDEWRKQDNPWRADPFKITNLPTLVKVTADGNVEKLVEADVYNQRKLDAFVGF